MSCLLPMQFYNYFQVKYLGEDGINVPVTGAAAICCPWDLLVSIWMIKL